MDFEQRTLEILNCCPVCGALRAKAVQVCKKTEELKTFSPKGAKRTREFIRQIEMEPYLEFKKKNVKQGTWANEITYYNFYGTVKNFNGRKIELQRLN